MIGIDLASISRFKEKSDFFAKRILSEKEFVIWKKSKNPKFLATRWAIKEAIFKADNNYYEFNKINIIKNKKKYEFLDFLITTSSENDIVIAFVKKKE